MKRLSILILALAAVLSAVSCANPYKDLAFTDFKVISVSLRSGREVDVVAEVGVRNPSRAFKVETLEGVLRTDVQELLQFSAADIDIDARTEKTYRIPLEARLSDGISVVSVLGSVMENGDKAFKVDVKLRARLWSGAGRTLEFKDIQL